MSNDADFEPQAQAVVAVRTLVAQRGAEPGFARGAIDQHDQRFAAAAACATPAAAMACGADACIQARSAVFCATRAAIRLP